MSKKAISEQLRAAIRNSEMSRYELAKRSGVGESSLSRFLSEQNSLTLDSVDAIGRVLGLRIVTTKTTKRKGN